MTILLDEKVRWRFNNQTRVSGILPIKVSSHYKKLVDDEFDVLAQVGGPLYRAVYPTEERMLIKIDHEVPDFVEDWTNMLPELEMYWFGHCFWLLMCVQAIACTASGRMYFLICRIENYPLWKENWIT